MNIARVARVVVFAAVLSVALASLANPKKSEVDLLNTDLVDELVDDISAPSPRWTKFTLHNPTPADLKSALEREHGVEVIEKTDEDGTNLLQVFAPEHKKAAFIDMGLHLIQAELGEPFAELRSSVDVFQGYHNRTELHSQFESLVKRYPHLATLVDLTAKYGLPATARGNHIYALKVSDNVHKEEPSEHNHLLVSNHHAREIVVPELALYIATQLLSNYATDSSIRKIVDENQVYIIYTQNPDGLDIVWNENRWNRVNARGVDLNRNYALGWDAECGGDMTQGSETYRGEAPFSEVETQTMRAFQADKNFAKLMDFHSYSQEVRHGYASCGSLDQRIQNHFADLSKTLASAMTYEEAPSCCLGGDISWAYAAHGSTPLLVETASDFQPQSSEVEAENKKVWAGVKLFLQTPIPVSGTVLSKAGKPLKDVEIVLPDYKFYLNETKPVRSDGLFHLWVPADKKKLKIAVRVGKDMRHAELVDVHPDGKVLEIRL